MFCQSSNGVKRGSSSSVLYRRCPLQIYWKQCALKVRSSSVLQHTVNWDSELGQCFAQRCNVTAHQLCTSEDAAHELELRARLQGGGNALAKKKKKKKDLCDLWIDRACAVVSTSHLDSVTCMFHLAIYVTLLPQRAKGKCNLKVAGIFDTHTPKIYLFFFQILKCFFSHLLSKIRLCPVLLLLDSRGQGCSLRSVMLHSAAHPASLTDLVSVISAEGQSLCFPLRHHCLH